MAASAWIKFDKSIYYGMTGTIDYSDATAGAFKCALLLDTWTPVTTADTWADISANEHANANGYTTGGEALTNIAFTNSSGTDTWNADDITWTALGGTIVALYAVIYHVSSGKLIRYCSLDSSSVTALDGTDLAIVLATSGIFNVN